MNNENVKDLIRLKSLCRGENKVKQTEILWGNIYLYINSYYQYMCI